MWILIPSLLSPKKTANLINDIFCIQGVAIKKPDSFYYSFLDISIMRRRV